MRVLITPLVCPLETAGPMQRAAALADAFMEAGHDVAMSTGQDANFRPVTGVTNFSAPLPQPLGLPWPFGSLAMNIALHTGLLKKKAIHSFEQVLFLMGVLKPSYFSKDCRHLEKIIDKFCPDVIYSEFRLPAIVTAKKKGIPITGSLSYPAQPSYRCDPQFSKKLRLELKKSGMPEMNSILELFSLQEKSFIASSSGIEPVQGQNIYHVGPFFSMPKGKASGQRNLICVYLGNSSIRPSSAIDTLQQTLRNSEFQVYFAAKGHPEQTNGNLHIAPRHDFTKLLPLSAVFIHHGGQNSSVSGLLCGCPQLIFPGKIFERQYNADSIERLGAGLRLKDHEFQPAELNIYIEKITGESSFCQEAQMQGEELRKLGGAEKIVREVETLKDTG